MAMFIQKQIIIIIRQTFIIYKSDCFNKSVYVVVYIVDKYICICDVM